MKDRSYLLIIVYILAVLALGLLLKPVEEVIDINSLVIKFYPGYNIATAEAINDVNKEGDFVQVVTIKVEGEDFNKLSSMISEFEPTTFDFSTCNCAYIMDEYEIIVNGETIYSLGEEYGFNDEFTFDVSNDFNILVNSILSKYDNQIYKRLSTTNAKIIKDNEEIILTDEEVSDILEYKYYVVNQNEPYETYDGGYKYEVVLDKGISLYLYDTGMAYLSNGSESTYINFVYRDKYFYNYIDTLYKNRKLDLDKKLTTDKITIDYNGEKYFINDEAQIKELLYSFKRLDYNRPHFLLSYTSDRFNEGHIIITVNNCKYVIPEEEYLGNRYFIDTDGTIYDVACNEFNNIERIIKLVINYN